MEDLQLRVVEHNILTIRKYYSRITLSRLSQLLDLDVATAEKHLSDMVVAKGYSAPKRDGNFVVIILFKKI